MLEIVKEDTSSSIKWKDRDLLGEIVKAEYGRQKKDKYIDISLKLLDQNQLTYLSDWKKLSKEDRNKLPLGLKTILNEAANIKDEVRATTNKGVRRETKGGSSSKTMERESEDGHNRQLDGSFPFLLRCFFDS